MKMKRLLLIILAVLTGSVTYVQNQSLELDHLIGNSEVSLSNYEMNAFKKHLTERLPNYIEHFKKYADEHDIPWVLLAAVAYQESKWNPKAVSYTGVRGFMQITEQTAQQIGLNNRDNPIESIRGGAYYLKYLFNKTSPELSETQRWMQALTAYNLGWGGFRDAYRLAVHLKKDPQTWDDLKNVLPKMGDEAFVNHLRYGPSRGDEAVRFVESVISYYILLNQSVGRNFLVARL